MIITITITIIIIIITTTTINCSTNQSETCVTAIICFSNLSARSWIIGSLVDYRD